MARPKQILSNQNNDIKELHYRCNIIINHLFIEVLHKALYLQHYLSFVIVISFTVNLCMLHKYKIVNIYNIIT